MVVVGGESRDDCDLEWLDTIAEILGGYDESIVVEEGSVLCRWRSFSLFLRGAGSSFLVWGRGGGQYVCQDQGTYFRREQTRVSTIYLRTEIPI